MTEVNDLENTSEGWLSCSICTPRGEFCRRQQSSIPVAANVAKQLASLCHYLGDGIIPGPIKHCARRGRPLVPMNDATLGTQLPTSGSQGRLNPRSSPNKNNHRRIWIVRPKVGSRLDRQTWTCDLESRRDRPGVNRGADDGSRPEISCVGSPPGCVPQSSVTKTPCRPPRT